MDSDLSIYIHWPYCLSKCPYCDFNSHLADSIDHSIWLSSYIKELESFTNIINGKHIKSVFFGGGTPSLMKPSVIAGIINKISELAFINEQTEITLEANPTSFEIEKFKEFRLAGINRVSVGVQALNKKDLVALGRKHDTIEAKRAIEIASQLFPKSSFDLIYARSGQTLPDWQNELESAIAMASGHISLYQLTIEKGTPFYKLFHDGTLTIPSSDLAADMYEWTTNYLASKGYNRYEISNYAKQEHECTHNLAYWNYKSYLGIGPGAHSRIHQHYTKDTSKVTRKMSGELAERILIREHKRIPKFDNANLEVSKVYRGDKFLASDTPQNLEDKFIPVHSMMMWHKPEKWLQSVDNLGSGVQSCHELTRQEIVEEIFMMGLRLKNGIDSSKLFKLTGFTIADVIDKKTAEIYINSGILDWSNDIVRLTNKGLMLHSYVVPRLLNL